MTRHGGTAHPGYHARKERERRAADPEASRAYKRNGVPKILQESGRRNRRVGGKHVLQIQSFFVHEKLRNREQARLLTKPRGLLHSGGNSGIRHALPYKLARTTRNMPCVSVPCKRRGKREILTRLAHSTKCIRHVGVLPRLRARLTTSRRNNGEPCAKRLAIGAVTVTRNSLSKELTPDHLTPYSSRGVTRCTNILPCCISCNSRKKAGAVLKPVQPFLLLSDEAAAD